MKTFGQKRLTKPFRHVSRFHYQLQNLDTFINAHNKKDTSTIFVTDYSKDGTDAGAFSAGEIKSLKNGYSNVVLSYLSVGEAEDYRWYYSSIPKDLFGPENPNWPGNFPVKYWDSRWQEIIAGENSSLSRIQNAGFDGVFLDVVDVFYQYLGSRPSACSEMVDFIDVIAKVGRVRNPHFLVFVQNAPCLPDRDNFSNVSDSQYAEIMQKFWGAINGISLESTFFNGSKWEDNGYNPQQDVINCLGYFQRQNKLALDIEYIQNVGHRAQAMGVFNANKLLGFMSDRLLKGESPQYSNRVYRRLYYPPSALLKTWLRK